MQGILVSEIKLAFPKDLVKGLIKASLHCTIIPQPQVLALDVQVVTFVVERILIVILRTSESRVASVVEALKHGGITNHATVHIKWIDSEAVTRENAARQLSDVQGILVPGGFGGRGIDGMLYAIEYARTNRIPYLGLCLGMQLSIVEYARNAAGLTDAHSMELDPDTPYPVIALMPDQNGVEDIGGTLRLGSCPCVLAKDSKAYALYGEQTIHERHRHRYEVNNEYRSVLTEHGLKLSGTSPDGRIVEMIEIPDHPFFLATQAHPELKSRPNRPHPLFKGFIAAALK